MLTTLTKDEVIAALGEMSGAECDSFVDAIQLRLDGSKSSQRFVSDREKVVINNFLSDVLGDVYGVMPVRRNISCVDNRDDKTTWIWISDTEYVEIDPQDIYDNMIENCFGGR